MKTPLFRRCPRPPLGVPSAAVLTFLIIVFSPVYSAGIPTITIRGGATYSGSCTNETIGVSATLRINLQSTPDAVSGRMEIIGDLVGGGSFVGRREGDTVTFTTSGLFGEIRWTGQIQGKTLGGGYTAILPDNTVQHGIWRVSQ